MTVATARAGRRTAIVLLVVVVLLAGLAVAAEVLARVLVQQQIRGLVVSQTNLPPDHDVDVGIPGLVLPQLIAGTLGEVRIASDDVTAGPVTGDVDVRRTAVPVRGDAAAGPGEATVRLDEDELRALLATIDGFPADTVALDAPDVTISVDLNLFGATLGIGVALRPGAADGDVVLSPQSYRVGDANVDAQDLRQRFGALADPVVGEWRVCVAQDLPAALTLTDLRVEGDQAVATFAIDGAIVSDETLRRPGTCD